MYTAILSSFSVPILDFAPMDSQGPLPHHTSFFSRILADHYISLFSPTPNLEMRPLKCLMLYDTYSLQNRAQLREVLFRC